jgi:hypothetical protein
MMLLVPARMVSSIPRTDLEVETLGGYVGDMSAVGKAAEQPLSLEAL